MTNKRKLSAKEKPIFSNMERASRKLVYLELAEDRDFSEVMKKYCDIIAFEKRIKKQWDKNLLRELSSSKFDGYIFSLCLKIQTKIDIPHHKKGKRVKQVYPRALKYRDRLKFQGTPSRNAELFCQICKDYLQRKEDFNKRLSELMAKDVPTKEIIHRLTELYAEEDAKKDAKKFLIYALQYTKHGFKNKQPVAPALIETALDQNFISTPDIFEEQIDVICQTYDAYKDHTTAIEVKKICYEFIEKAFLKYKKVDARLINFLFLGDWISVGTSNLLCRAFKIIKERELNFFVFETIKKLYNKIEFSQEEYLSESEKLICTLYEIFKPV